jgi:uncharacterized membrane protein
VDAHSLTPLFVVALVIWGMYRRVRRSFGPQPIRPRALMFRACLFILIAALILIFIPRTPALLGSVIGGMGAGVVLGHVGLRHTRFEITERGKVYIPHTYIGLFVTSLLIIRLALRYISMNVDPQQAMQPQNPWAAYQRNPLTLAMFGLVVGYYVFYNIGVLRRSREPALPAAESSSP